jgi:hypothetical protein
MERSYALVILFQDMDIDIVRMWPLDNVILYSDQYFILKKSLCFMLDNKNTESTSGPTLLETPNSM